MEGSEALPTRVSLTYQNDPLHGVPQILESLDGIFQANRQLINNYRRDVDNSLGAPGIQPWTDDFLRTLRQQVERQLGAIRVLTTSIQNTRNHLVRIGEMHPPVKNEPKLVEALATVDRQMEIARYYSTLADGQQRKINTEMALGPVLERGTPPSSDHGPGGSGDDEFVPSTDSSPVLSIHSESGRDVVGA